jgi:tetratricopeptide (TPR) repeat protein
MTGLVIAALLALLAGLGIVVAVRTGRSGWEPVAAALLIGLAGYAWQGRPGLAGKPVSASAERAVMFDERLVERRMAMGGRFGSASKWLVLSDGLARQGQTQDAANILVSGLRENPRDPDLWVGLGNALVLHEEGILSPAAEYAYRQALRLAPGALSPRYFFALALARSGKLAPARALWAKLAEDLPPGTPFRAELERNIDLIDQAMASQGADPAMAP